MNSNKQNIRHNFFEYFLGILHISCVRFSISAFKHVFFFISGYFPQTFWLGSRWLQNLLSRSWNVLYDDSGSDLITLVDQSKAHTKRLNSDLFLDLIICLGKVNTFMLLSFVLLVISVKTEKYSVMLLRTILLPRILLQHYTKADLI